MNAQASQVFSYMEQHILIFKQVLFQTKRPYFLWLRKMSIYFGEPLSSPSGRSTSVVATTDEASWHFQSAAGTQFRQIPTPPWPPRKTSKWLPDEAMCVSLIRQQQPRRNHPPHPQARLLLMWFLVGALWRRTIRLPKKSPRRFGRTTSIRHRSG